MTIDNIIDGNPVTYLFKGVDDFMKPFRRFPLRILVDTDGVTCALHVPWLGAYNADYNDRLTLKDITEWDMHKLVKPECGKKIYNYPKDPKIYGRAPTIEHSLEAILELKARGHEIIHVSAGFNEAKIEWLKTWRYTVDPSKDVIFTARKDLILGDVLIDDNYKNLSSSGCAYKILFRQPWNEKYGPGLDWKEILELDYLKI